MKSRVRLHFQAKPQSVCSIGWRWSLTLFFALVTAGCITVSLFPQAMPLREKTVQGTAADKILMMDISGVISEKGSSNPLSESEDLVARIKEELTLAAEDSHINALLLRINSPGGTVTASDVIHHEINEFKSKRKIPVVAVIMDVGASGGYYLAVRSGSSNPLSESEDLVARIKEELTLAAEDSHINALLLRINSPGGTVTASDVIHHEINEFKSKRKIPVVAVIMDVGASGGYYVAVAADQIIAHPTSVTGSVGVIMLRV